MKAKNDLLSGGRKVRHFSLQRSDGFASELTFSRVVKYLQISNFANGCVIQSSGVKYESH